MKLAVEKTGKMPETGAMDVRNIVELLVQHFSFDRHE